MKQWEYIIRDIPLGSQFDQEDWLDTKGREGWELCGIATGVNGVYGFFKKELKD